ncbi:MAG: molybdenum cofactor biosynthesis protein B [Candidatus Thorarchaeota archaeon]
MKVHEEHKKKGPEIINIVLVIVSSTRKATTDKTIPLIKNLLEEHESVLLNATEIVPDNKWEIKDVLDKFLTDKSIHAIIFSGGTGLTPKDITYETIKPLLQKEITGFGELFRYLSYREIGSAAMLSRATGGKIQDKAVFLLPGSPKAVELAFKELIIPEIRHIVYMINKEE